MFFFCFLSFFFCFVGVGTESYGCFETSVLPGEVPIGYELALGIKFGFSVASGTDDAHGVGSTGSSLTFGLGVGSSVVLGLILGTGVSLPTTTVV